MLAKEVLRQLADVLQHGDWMFEYPPGTDAPLGGVEMVSDTEANLTIWTNDPNGIDPIAKTIRLRVEEVQ